MQQAEGATVHDPFGHRAQEEDGQSGEDVVVDAGLDDLQPVERAHVTYLGGAGAHR